MNPDSTVARLSEVSLFHGGTRALDAVTLALPAGRMLGLIGPDGVGKSSMLSLIAGAHAIQQGEVEVLGGSMRDKRHREDVCPRIAYMPQGLGRNLYPALSVEENLQFFGRLFGHGPAERRRRIDQLTAGTGLQPFLDRPAGKLSGGMKQKLGLCCALIHDPDLLILDEPTTGVDPLSRSQFWELLDGIRRARPEMSVIVATAYMDEAERFAWLVAMDDGRLLATGTPAELRTRTGTETLEEAFVALLPDEKRRHHQRVEITPYVVDGVEDVAIEARDLTMRFGKFTAVDHVNFRIRRGEIFGFLGSNGCGKTTTMKMLTGLLPASEGQAWLFGRTVDPHDLATRRRVGYMSQSFSLYTELNVEQNLVLHARLFHVPGTEIPERVREMAERFDLLDLLSALPESLPLGVRQRLSLAVAMVHKPELLILDEPTSGVDPIARDNFWKLMIDLSRKDRVTIFISTHFMNEAERCDRISLMHAGKVLTSDGPAEIVRKRHAPSLEAAFIAELREAASDPDTAAARELPPTLASAAAESTTLSPPRQPWLRHFSVQRCITYLWREMLELRRDPIRLALAGLGSIILLFIMGFGISLDVENLNYAVLDRDQTGLSRNYALNLSGSRYFSERPPLSDYDELDRRMRSGELTLAVEIPPDFARDLARGKSVQLAAWVDGAMPQRAETVVGYAKGMHLTWLAEVAMRRFGVSLPESFKVETRYRYNPDVRSLPAMVPAVIPLLLLMIPSLLSALAVVREKELGSIINFYVTPTTRAEFLIGKQLPYLAMGTVNFLALTLLAITVFGVPLTGNFPTLLLGAILYLLSATGFGLLAATFTRSQTAALFLTMVATMVPATQFSGMIHPVSSLSGAGRFLGEIFPTTYFLNISRGVFSKALGFLDLQSQFVPLLLMAPVIIGLSIALLKKQDTR